MENEHLGGPPDDRVTGFPPYQLDRSRSEMTASPAFSQNGGSAYGPPAPRTPGSPALSARSDARSDHRPSDERNRSRGRSGGRSGSGAVRVCHKCGEQLTGQFVRALDGTFHLDCFKCRDCGQIVASKFFPAEDEQGGGQYPLCETDYFRRLGLLCHQCGGALRGSYITALDRKYHVDHFTCTLCSTVFGAQDSYYEHDSNVYCHYHYSTQFAQRCNGCQTAILKQFVEIFRNGQNQHWHPECYMIHKFWNVRLTTPQDAPAPPKEPVSDQDRELIRRQEESMEDKVYKIWSVLSTFEESSAACISDMLLHVSNGAYVDGVFVAKKFIVHVEILFKSADRLDETMKRSGMRGLSYGREAKLLCKKIVSFFSLLSKTQDTGVRKLGVTQELLSLVTGLAHYLKLLIRICLQGTLKLEREHRSVEGLHQFLDDLGVLENMRTDESSLQMTLGMASLSANDSDQCKLCRKPIEDSCALHGDKRWHEGCVNCTICGKEHGMPPNEARVHRDEKIYCIECEAQTEEWGQPLERVSKLQQYVFLLKVALARLLEILRNSGALPHTSEDPNLNGYDSMDGHRLSFSRESVLLRSDSRSKSYAGDPERHQREVSYENTLNDVRRLRSTRLDKHLSTSLRKARSSRVIDGPERGNGRPGSAGADSGFQSRDPRIDEDRELGLGASTEQYFGHQDALTLDDIPRIVAAEQAREQQPAAYRQSRQELFRSPATDPSFGPGHQRSQSGGREQDYRGQGERSPQRGGGRRFFSELSGLEYFIVRHVAVLTMQPLLESEFTLEELLGLIEARKAPTFWNKFGKAFGTKENKKNVKKKGVFGVPLEVAIERDGADSTDGVGPGALRIPAIVEDIITAMKNKDLSVEGVFRKNGNIKRLTEQVAAVDRDGCDAVRWNDETPHQLAALLKRYLRELPDPLMTQKLYRLWTVATKISDADKRRHCLHLACCLLPQPNRDSLEVLFSFLKWVSTFHQVDEENGSRMDVHNLARVIAPNVLYSTAKSPSFSDEPMVAVSCVEDLIQFIEDMCMVPVELMDILGDSSLFSNSGEITTKEILKRIESRAVSGGVRQYDVEYAGRQDANRRPLATRVETDPIAWQKESSVRPIQEPAYPSGQNPGTPPQKWRNPDFPRGDDGLDPPDKSQRREWRQSAPAGRPPNSVTTGTG
ncbi:RhoGAP domain-containing protein [Microdochium trichocladiopsis]|uniref:RhoGAP domain-containing protein n=1 Tax=Microdochium trichocladiopsis TaxID=1682393 RepID=A0A9P9BQV6_9PEZI|nr:RhoGAP domain-containing protein [Microdochium trichocladiopsis]KAH7035293.1 RhoGAP domain-containing protein [Microdochium trichocladiopsis]